MTNKLKGKIMEQNIKDLVASVKKEQVESGIETGVVPQTSLSGMFSGRANDTMVKEASDAQAISDEIAKDIGVDTLEVSQKIEKIAEDMSKADSVEAIIKIASESGNNDLLNLKTIATSLASVVVADIESRETI